MQVTEELIRSVVQQVLAQMATGAGTVDGRGNRGRHGVFTLRRTRPSPRPPMAFEQLSDAHDRRPQADHRPHPPHLDRAGGRAGHDGDEETKIGRLEHKIEKLKTLGERMPGVEFLRSEVFSGDNGLALIEYAPFGVIGAITPVTHSLPTSPATRSTCSPRGNTIVVNPHPSGKRVAAEGRAAVQRGDLPAIGHRQPDLRHRRADAGIGRGDLRPPRRQA